MVWVIEMVGLLMTDPGGDEDSDGRNYKDGGKDLVVMPMMVLLVMTMKMIMPKTKRPRLWELTMC